MKTSVTVARPGRTLLQAVRPGHDPSEAPIRAICPMPIGSWSSRSWRLDPTNTTAEP